MENQKTTLVPLSPPDSLHLEAAQGWLELGNHLEANEELEKITTKLRVHPDVLEMRWEIFARAKKWEACLDIAKAIAQLAPERPFGWIHVSYALHEMGRTKEACENLIAVADKFPKLPTILYNLACYSCRLGHLEDARKLLEKAFKYGDPETKLMALADRDLEALWKHIGDLDA